MLREYYRFKQSAESEEMLALIYFVVEQNVPEESARTKVVQCLDDTDDPAEFIKCIEGVY